MKTWSFHNPTSIHIESSFPEALTNHVEKKKTLLIVSGGSVKRGVAQKISAVLASAGIDSSEQVYSQTNPSFTDLLSIVEEVKGKGLQQIISVGGGSILDLGKILSYVLASEALPVQEILNSLVQGKALPLVSPLSFIAVPTTSGTGSEVTPFSTIWDMENKKKYSITASNLFPRKAILFPVLTHTLPWDVTLSTGLDALSQCLESIWNKNNTPLTDALAVDGIAKIFEALPKLKKNPEDALARVQMAEASMFSGFCISRTRTAMAHAISYPLTAHYGTPHGIACSFTLADLWNHNFVADQERLNRLSLLMGFAGKDLGHKLNEFMKSLDFSVEFKKTVRSTDDVVKLASEMFTPGRADNNLRAFDTSFEKFVAASAQQWL